MHGNQTRIPFSLPVLPRALAAPPVPAFEPELLYVECAGCGRPVLWENGRTRMLVDLAGVHPAQLDHSCLILTSACSCCQPRGDTYEARIIRLHGDADVDGMGNFDGYGSPENHGGFESYSDVESNNDFESYADKGEWDDDDE